LAAASPFVFARHAPGETPRSRVTPYDSLANIAAIQFPYFPPSVGCLLDKVESWRYAPKVTAPTKMIAAQNDEIIPLASTESLYKRLLSIAGDSDGDQGASGHNNISDSPEYIRLLARDEELNNEFLSGKARFDAAGETLLGAFQDPLLARRRRFSTSRDPHRVSLTETNAGLQQPKPIYS